MQSADVEKAALLSAVQWLPLSADILTLLSQLL